MSLTHLSMNVHLFYQWSSHAGIVSLAFKLSGDMLYLFNSFISLVCSSSTHFIEIAFICILQCLYSNNNNGKKITGACLPGAGGEEVLPELRL